MVRERPYLERLIKAGLIISQKTLWIIKHRFIVKIPETLEKHWELTGSA